MNPARQKAKDILRELNIDRPELLDCLKEICIERGAYVREDRLDHAEARLTVDGKRGIITVNPNPGYGGRTRFSIAHELGHFELHRKPNTARVDCGMKDLNDWSSTQETVPAKKGRRHLKLANPAPASPTSLVGVGASGGPGPGAPACADESQCREKEANEFASELLMPEEFVRPEIHGQKPSLGLIEKLSETFQTSLFASSRRFIDLTPEACAVVFFRDGSISYAWRSEKFKALNLWLGGKLSPRTYAAQAAAGAPVPGHMASVDAAAWLEVPKWAGHETILEQARYFNMLGMGMSLLYIDSEKLSRGF